MRKRVAVKSKDLCFEQVIEDLAYLGRRFNASGQLFKRRVN
jgi:hypothetical protein